MGEKFEHGHQRSAHEGKKQEDLKQLLEEAKESRPCAGERAVMTQEEILRVYR